jgi:diguanylate cyclase (GGDEF)-like protein/PAS domain S-box-containing protein
MLLQVLESTSDCIMSFDRDWRFTFLNSRATTELHAGEELVGRHVLEAYPALAETPFWPAYQQVMSTRQPCQVEAFMPGFEAWYEVYAAPINDGITLFFRNIDTRKRGEEALKERAAQFRKTLDHIPQMVWSALPDGHHDYFSQPWYDYTGVSVGSTDGEAWNGMFHPDDQERAWALWRHSLQTGDPYEIEYRLRHHSGEYRWVLGRAWPERDLNGQIVRWYGTCTDIHERVCAQHALHESETLQQSVLEASTDCIKLLALDGTLEFMNGPGQRAMELNSADKVLGKKWINLWPVQGRKAAQSAIEEALMGGSSRFTGYCPTAKGKPKWWDVVISPVFNEAGTVARLVAISRDVTLLRETSDQLKWASDHDALTSLPNRRAFEAHLQAAILRAMQKGTMAGLLLLDLDHFKHVNDTLGHSAGDHLLRAFAERLRSATRKVDFVARLGGDEFAVIIEDVRQESELLDAGRSILERLKAPVLFDGRVISGSASIGGAIYPRDADTSIELLKNADTALYALKEAGRGGTRMFHNYMREEAQRVASQLSLARLAITERSVVPHYQPKVALKSGAIAGFEALLRWQHPTRGMQEPDTVAEAFKDYELATRIGELMQDKIFEDISAWRRRGMELDHVALNAAPAEFLRDDYAEKLLCRLDRFRLPPSLIEVEVTEHAFLERGSQYVGRALEQLKQAGIRISLDDFGTGHSSLSHLRDFPVDVVKIDRSFVAQMINDQEIAAIVRAVIDLARSLSLTVVAEGIETAAQLDLLKVMGCEFGQGWFFGRAAQSDEICRHISRAA